MHFIRRPRVVAITILLGASLYTLVSIGLRFSVFDNLMDKVLLQRRDGSTISFSMPWISAIGLPALETPPDIKLANPTKSSPKAGLLDSNKLVSVDVQKGPNAVSIVASILNEVSAFINVVVDGSTMVGDASGIMSSATVPSSLLNPLNTTAVQNSTGRQSGLVPQTNLCSTCNNSRLTTAFKPNITAPTSLPYSPPSSTLTCPMTSFSCPGPITETCTVTETWHSTHYESTATMYSFMKTLTVTCTETVSVCPPSNPFTFNGNSTTTASVSPSLVACANGALARRADDCVPASNTSISTHPCPDSGYACAECPDGVFCPPAQTPAQSCSGGMGWACGHCSDSWYCLPVSTTSSSIWPVDTAASLLLSNGSSSSESLAATHFSFNSANSVKISSILASQASPDMSQATSNTEDGQIVAEVTSAIGNIPGLTGTLLSSVVAQVASIMAQVDGSAGILPTVAAAVSGGTSAIGGEATSIVGGAIQTGISDGGAISNNALSGLNAAAGNIKAIVSNTISKTEATPTIPVITLEVHPLPANPSEDTVAAVWDVLNGGTKGRRRATENVADISLEDLIFCAENPDDDSCYEDGRDRLWTGN